MIYDARLGPSSYGAMFNCLTNEPYPEYYSFVAFNELYKLGNQVCVSGQEEGVYAVGAINDNKGCLVISNVNDKELSLDITSKGKVVKAYNAIKQGENDLNLLSKLPPFSVVVVKFDL